MGLFWRAGAGGVFPGEAARHGGEAGNPVPGRIHARGGLGQIQRDPHRPHRRHAQPLRQARPGAAPFRLPLKSTKSLEIDNPWIVASCARAARNMRSSQSLPAATSISSCRCGPLLQKPRRPSVADLGKRSPPLNTPPSKSWKYIVPFACANSRQSR